MQAAEGYAIDRVNRAQGDAQRFIALQQEYRQGARGDAHAACTSRRMSEVLPKAGSKLVLDDETQGHAAAVPPRRHAAGGRQAGGEADERVAWLAVVGALVALLVISVQRPVHGVGDRAGDHHPVRQPIGKPITSPGLHLQAAVRPGASTSSTSAGWSGTATPNQIPTRDKKYIWVDTYARWRIADPLQFFQRLRDERGAQSRLDDIIDGETRNVIANHNLIEVVRSTQPQVRAGEEAQDVMAEEDDAAGRASGATRSRRLILERASQVMPDYGIELVDVQIQRINYVETVQAKVFERMISERKRIADRFRSEGQGRQRRDPRREGARAEAHRVRGLPQGPGDHGQGRRRGGRASTPAPTTSRPTRGSSTSS